ncbi:MAG: hypothetical protein QF566_04680 [Candidatus Thalassarchaeaceae archaeon]|nr:hypothetical protein [Candidatus Thalassarchaeaceae archaeon]
MVSDEGDITQVSTAQLQAIENQLFSLVRQQAKRNHPIELPRPDFWTQVAVLLANIDTELAEIGKNEGWSAKAVNLSRKQGNVRRAVADLTQHRLTSFVRHASTDNLTLAPHGDALGEAKKNLTPLDWQRHDVAERSFYEGLNELIEKYKHQVSWNVLQQGLLAEVGETPTVKPGTTQLDSFVKQKGGLTGQGPPKIEVEKTERDPYDDPDDVEEDRISRMSAYPTSGMINPDVSSSSADEATATSHDEEDGGLDSDSSDASTNMIRIKILQDLPEPIIDADGNELELMTGDIEFCDFNYASGLIAAGLAEKASL